MPDTGFGAPELSPRRPVMGEWWTVRLDGVADYFKRAALTITEFDANWTIAGWFNQDAAAAEVVFEVSDGTANERIQVSLTVGGAVQANQVDTGGVNNNTVTSAATVAAGQWNHVAVTRTTNLFEIWINGVKDANTMSVATRPSMLAASGEVNIGTDQALATYFSGYLSQWMVYERTLSTLQLQELSGQVYGANQLVEGRINYRLNFSTSVRPGTPPVNLTLWPTTLFGVAPTHQWFTLDFWGALPLYLAIAPYPLAVPQLLYIDQGASQETQTTWVLVQSSSIDISNARKEQGYFGFDESTISESDLADQPAFQSLIDPVTGGDWGFGDPDPAGGVGTYDKESGFGSPYVYIDADTVQILEPLGTFGDDGGYIAAALADWPIQGPYRFRLVDTSTSDEFPEDGGWCHSGIPTQSFNCYTLTGGVDVVRFTIPPAPPGTYYLKVQWGDDFGMESVQTVPGVTIIIRNRSLLAYAVRRSFPPFYKVGPVTVRQDPMLPAAPYVSGLPWGWLEGITMVMGRQLQTLAGRPLTRVRTDFEPADITLAVESTLGFSDSGKLWIDGRLFAYTSKTSDTFVGVTTDDGLERTAIIGIKTAVVQHIPSALPA